MEAVRTVRMITMLMRTWMISTARGDDTYSDKRFDPYSDEHYDHYRDDGDESNELRSRATK